MINKNMLDNLSPGFTYFLVSKNEIMGQSSESKISALYDACVKNNLLYKKYASLSPSAYKTFCNNNKNVTEGDILQLSLES